MPEPEIEDSNEYSLDEIKTALRRKLNGMRPDEREEALGQLEGDRNFSDVVQEYRYPIPGGFTEEAFKPAAPVKVGGYLTRGGVTTATDVEYGQPPPPEPKRREITWAPQPGAIPGVYWPGGMPTPPVGTEPYWRLPTAEETIKAGARAGIEAGKTVGRTFQGTKPFGLFEIGKPEETPPPRGLPEVVGRMVPGFLGFGEPLTMEQLRQQPPWMQAAMATGMGAPLESLSLAAAQAPAALRALGGVKGVAKEAKIALADQTGAFIIPGGKGKVPKKPVVKAPEAVTPAAEGLTREQIIAGGQGKYSRMLTAAVDEPWKLRGIEYDDIAQPLGAIKILQKNINKHKRLVKQALSEGKPVPPEVLADYPELAAKAKPPVTTKRMTIAERNEAERAKVSQQLSELEAGRLRAEAREAVPYEVGDTVRVMGDDRVIKEIIDSPQTFGGKAYYVEGLNQPVNAQLMSLVAKAAKVKPPITGVPKTEAVSFQEGVNNLHRVATDEVISPQLRLEQPAGARLWPSEAYDMENLIRKPAPPPIGLPSELPGAKYPGPPTGLPSQMPGVKYPGPPTGLPPIPPDYFESFASSYGPKPKFTPPIETLIARGKEFTGDEVSFQYAMRGAQEAAPKMGAVGAKVNWLRAIADPVRRLNPDVRIAWQAASAYSREQAERVQELLVGISGGLEQAFGKEAISEGARVFKQQFKGKATESLDPYIGSVWHYLENPTDYRNMTALQKRMAEEWKAITNAERDFSARMGVDIGEVEGTWIAHTFKDPEKAREIIARKGLPLPKFRERVHTTEEFAQIAADLGLEIETDVLKIAVRRLNGTAKARTHQIFLNSVAKKLGGRPLKPFTKTPIGYQAIQSGGKFWVFPEDVTDDVGRILRPLAEPADEAMVGQAIDAARNVLLNLDFSIGGARQGLLGFVGNPLGAVKAYQEAWQVLRQPEGMAIHLAMNAPEYELAARHGLVLNMSPLDISIGLKGMPKPWLDKVPVLGAWNNFQFNTLMRPLKLAVWKGNYATLKSVRDGKGLSGVAQRFPILGQAVKKFGGKIYKMTDDELMDAAAEASNNWVGGIDWSRIMPGERPSTMRRAILLTEGWTRANIGAFVNLPKISAQGIMARRLLMQELAILMGVTTAVNVASTGDLPTLDPRSMDFGVINVGPFKIRIIPHGSYIRAFARIVGGEPEKGWARNKSELTERIDAVWNLVEGRFGQPIRVVTDLARGKDYYGKDIDNKALYMARQGMPIVAQTVLEDMRRDTGVTLAARGVTEFVGFTTYGKPGSQRLLEMAQGKGVMLGVKSWDDLQPWQQAQIQMMPEARDILQRNMSQDTLKRWKIRWDAYDMQVKRDAELKAGKIKGSDWKDAYYQAQSELAARLDQFDEDFKRMRYNPETPEDKAMSGYYDTMEKAKSETGVFDGDRWEELRRDYMGTLSPELQKYVEENIGIYDTPQASIFRGLRKRLQPYWDTEDRIWAVFGDKAQEMKDRARRIDILATTDEAAAKAALTPAIMQALKVITERKKEWKEANPGLASILRKYYSY